MFDKTLFGKDVSKLSLCGLMAIHVITKIPLEKVTTDYKVKFLKGPKWRYITTLSNLKSMFSCYGHKFNVIRDRRTVRIFVELYGSQSTALMLYHRGHFITYMNGLLYDQSNLNGVRPDEYRRKNCKVVQALEFDLSN